MNEYEALAKQIRAYIGADKTNKAFDLLSSSGIRTIQNDLEILKNRFNRVNREIRTGVADTKDASLELNRINEALLKIADDVEKKSTNSISSPDRKKFFTVGGISILVIFFLFSLIFFLQKNDLEEWNTAKKINTKQSYQTYLTDFPAGDSSINAEKYITQINLEISRTERDSLDSEDWKNAKQIFTIDAFNKYISIHPTGDSLENAKVYVNEIKANQAWLNAFESKSFDQLSDFNASYANTNFIALNAIILKPIVEQKFTNFYRFDKNTQDVVGNKNAKAVKGNLYNADRFNNRNKAFTLDGVNDCLELPTLFEDIFSNGYSISLWVKLTGDNPGGVLFGQFLSGKSSNGVQLQKGHYGRYNHLTSLHSNRLAVDEFLGDTKTALNTKLSKPINSNIWTHVVITRDPQYVRFYSDGEKTDEWAYDEIYKIDDDEGDMKNYSGDIKLALIGARVSQNKFSSFFKGKIDDMGFINKTLSDKEVNFIYAVQKTPKNKYVK